MYKVWHTNLLQGWYLCLMQGRYNKNI